MKVSPLAGALHATAASVVPAAFARQAVGGVGGPWTVVSASLGNALTGALVEDPDLFAGHAWVSALTSPLRRDALQIRQYLQDGQPQRAGAALGASAGHLSGALSGAVLATRYVLAQTPAWTELARRLPLPPEFGPWVPFVVSTASLGLAQMVGGTLGGWVGQTVGGLVGGALPY